MGTEEGAGERPSTMIPEQIRGASAAAKRAGEAGDISPREAGGYREKLRELGDRIFKRRLGY